MRTLKDGRIDRVEIEIEVVRNGYHKGIITCEERNSAIKDMVYVANTETSARSFLWDVVRSRGFKIMSEEKYHILYEEIDRLFREMPV